MAAMVVVAAPPLKVAPLIADLPARPHRWQF